MKQYNMEKSEEKSITIPIIPIRYLIICIILVMSNKQQNNADH